MDLDGNGHLSAAELYLLFTKSLLLNVSIEEVQQLIAKADKNNNGQIEFGEFIAVSKTLPGTR